MVHIVIALNVRLWILSVYNINRESVFLRSNLHWRMNRMESIEMNRKKREKGKKPKQLNWEKNSTFMDGLDFIFSFRFINNHLSPDK